MYSINRIRPSASAAAVKRYFSSPTVAGDPNKFKSVKYWTEGRVAHVMLNRPERLNAIDHHMPFELEGAIKLANWDPSVRVILLSGAGNAFCAGYDLKLFAEIEENQDQEWMSQKMPWDPAKDFRFDSDISLSKIQSHGLFLL